MTIVVDASVVVALLVDSGGDGRWAESVIDGERLVAPHLLPVEVTNVLRRLARGGVVTDQVASLAHDDLGRLQVEYVPFEPVADRVWALRSRLRAYDAWYVALAEALPAPLVTLDRRLARSPGITCDVTVPAG